MSEFLVLIYDAEEPYENAPPDLWEEVFQAHREFAEYVVEKGGALRALQPTSTATTVRDGDARPGPFVDTPEVFCGYYLIEANDADHAVEIAQRCPAKFGGVEVRPIMPTPESQ